MGCGMVVRREGQVVGREEKNHDIYLNIKINIAAVYGVVQTCVLYGTKA